MKKMLLALALLALATIAATQFVARSVRRLTPVSETTSGIAVSTHSAPAQAVVSSSRPSLSSAPSNNAIADSSPRAARTSSNAPASRQFPTEDQIAFAAMVDTLVSPKSTYTERQGAFKQLLESGRIQDAIAELEQRSAADPNNADVLSVLAQAYLKACGTTKDVRSQAIWAMQADRDFESALSIDPNNWEARFTRSVAMTFWPADLNKGQEIVNNFNALIQQQEQQPPQPQFAATYDWLGRQYEKMGQADLAQQVWQRGAALFPDNQTLRARLASAP